MKQQVQRTLVVIALAAVALFVLRHLLTPILWAGLIAVATWPLHQRLNQRLGTRAVPWAAVVLTGLVVCLIVVPFIAVVVRGWHEAPVLVRLWASGQENGLPAPEWLAGVPVVGSWLIRNWNEQLGAPGALSDFVHSVGGGFDFRRDRALAALITHDVMKLFFCIVVLFFLYVDGAVLAAQIDTFVSRQLGPPGRRTLPVVVRSVRGCVNGIVLVAFGVALLMTTACAAIGIPHPAAVGLATGLLGMVPFGAMLVVAVVAVYLLAIGSTVDAIALFVVGAIAIFVADHFVRPKFMSSGAKLPLVLALLGIVGGLETFGILGLFLGPTLLAILVAVWRELASASATSTE